MLSTALALALSAAPLPEQLLSAKLVVEVSVALAAGTPPPCKPGEKCTRPPKVTWKTRTLKRVLLPEDAEAPPALKLPELPIPPCNAEGTLEFLAAYTQDAKGTWKPLPLEQQAQGRGTSCDVSYPKLIEAVLEAGHWREERMRAVAAELLWQPERKALHADNPWLRALAVEFLRTHGAAAVVDDEWGAARTPSRKVEEPKAALPPPSPN